MTHTMTIDEKSHKKFLPFMHHFDNTLQEGLGSFRLFLQFCQPVAKQPLKFITVTTVPAHGHMFIQLLLTARRNAPIQPFKQTLNRFDAGNDFHNRDDNKK